MPSDPMEFSDRVGVELIELLRARSRAELLELPAEAQFTAALGASILCVAEILRTPVERGVPAAKVAAICARQIESLLAQVPPSGDSPAAAG